MMSPSNCLPLFITGSVVKGFGRGSKQLGIPTANLPETVVKKLPQDLEAGIYYGFASVDHGPVRKMVASIGWNPFYHNTVKSLEVHIIHEFQKDFYGSTLSVILLGYIRPESSFTTLDDLIEAIHSDISIAREKLDLDCSKKFFNHPFWDFRDQENSVHVSVGIKWI